MAEGDDRGPGSRIRVELGAQRRCQEPLERGPVLDLTLLQCRTLPFALERFPPGRAALLELDHRVDECADSGVEPDHAFEDSLVGDLEAFQEVVERRIQQPIGRPEVVDHRASSDIRFARDGRERRPVDAPIAVQLDRGIQDPPARRRGGLCAAAQGVAPRCHGPQYSLTGSASQYVKFKPDPTPYPRGPFLS